MNAVKLKQEMSKIYLLHHATPAQESRFNTCINSLLFEMGQRTDGVTIYDCISMVNDAFDNYLMSEKFNKLDSESKCTDLSAMRQTRDIFNAILNIDNMVTNIAENNK